ncbi:PREDICTED: uncharacterized protein LOC108974019 [Bactrocera latifrons]|uniref:Uncharacterized protein n=1 Tax=Bactrocera latifrons TaxID=174628 RepID=A0A0K8UZ51_BACLA|nr:PREDICTED: uncharacterized protein LOC108974019 [Bactrocera latifrons]
MRLLNYLSCVLIIVALYGARVTIAILAAEDRANATPGTDTFLATPTRENIESTPRPSDTAYKAANCLTNSLNSDSIYCRGSRAFRNVIKNLNRRDKPLVLMRGLEIVPIEQVSNGVAAEPALESDDTFLGYVSDYLRSHELNIKFADLLADESERYLSYDMERNAKGDGVQEARKKDKGQGVILAMALMFGKMMAVMSLGGIGAMALKALGVAMTALMLAGLMGMKSLMHGGHESSHSVQYLSGGEGHHHMRRRRSSYDPLRLPYRGWHQKLAE